MSRSVLKIICVVSGILFAVLSVFMIISVALILGTMVSANVSIIGGAGAPTVEILLRNVAGSPVFYAAIVAFASFIGTGLALIFTKKSEK